MRRGIILRFFRTDELTNTDHTLSFELLASNAQPAGPRCGPLVFRFGRIMADGQVSQQILGQNIEAELVLTNWFLQSQYGREVQSEMSTEREAQAARERALANQAAPTPDSLYGDGGHGGEASDVTGPDSQRIENVTAPPR